jgi:tRNA 2-thiouridine synthesizing protein A
MTNLFGQLFVNPTDSQGVLEVDARGLNCPLPLLKAKQALRHMTTGQQLRVIATDRGSLRDFKAFAELSGHLLLEQTEEQGTLIHLLQKA